MNELVIKTKITSELEEREMNDLITLKQQHWGYSVEEHKNWLADNIHNRGIGIGLALSKEIIEHQNGTMRAKNLPNGGACFEIRLYKQ